MPEQSSGIDARSSIGNSFRNLSISLKVGLGFALVLGVLIVITGLSVFNFERAGSNVERLTATVGEARIIGKIETDFLKLQAQVATLIAQPTEESRDSADAALARLYSHFETSTNMVETESAVAALSAIEKDVRAYEEIIALIVRRQEAYQTLVSGTMQPAEREMNSVLTRLIDNLTITRDQNAITEAQSASMKALMVQKYAVQAIGLRDEQAAKGVGQMMVDLQSGLIRLTTMSLHSEDAGLVEETLNAVSRYEKALQQVLDDRAQIEALARGDMMALAVGVQSRAEALQAEADSTETTIKSGIISNIANAERSQVVIGTIGIILGVLSAFLIGRTLSKPLQAMTTAMVELSSGNLDVALPDDNRRDEIGKMAGALTVFRENAREQHRLKEEQQELERRAQAEKRQLLVTMADDFEASVGQVIAGVATASTNMQVTAGSMSETATRTNERSLVVSSAAQQAAVNVNTVASATEELSGSISEITRQVSKSTTIARQAIDEVRSMSGEMSNLRDTAEAIGSVIGLITDIADKTNLLSLNATIEAARAGDAGKGFAVVAGEVKNLASQTAKATDDIAKQIASVQSATDRAAEMMVGIGNTIEAINEITASVASAVEEQGAATQEIARNVQEAASGTEDVTENMSDVSSAASETGEASQSVLEAANQLSEQSKVLRYQMETFVNKLRAA